MLFAAFLLVAFHGCEREPMDSSPRELKKAEVSTLLEIRADAAAATLNYQLIMADSILDKMSIKPSTRKHIPMSFTKDVLPSNKVQ